MARRPTFLLAAMLFAALAASAGAQQTATPPATQGTLAPYQQAARLPARIMNFNVKPASIRRGQSVVLNWAAENPVGVDIEPCLGRVTPRGVKKLSPPATTTYTLTVRGPNDQTLTKTLTVNVEGTTPLADSAAACKDASKEVPRAADGKPDFSGVWDFSFTRQPNGGAPSAGGAAAGPELKPGAEKFRFARGRTTGTEDCMPLAGPQAFDEPYQFQIVQSSNHLAVLYGYPGTFRVIPTTGGVHPADPDPTWMGDSIGHWEGDTLVVDSVGFNDKTIVEGYHHTDKLHIVERFSRRDYNTLHYEATIEDPNVFVKPWTVTRNFPLRTDLSKVDEFVCENNHDYTKLFGDKK